MSGTNTERPSADELWKDAIEGFFEDFLKFFKMKLLTFQRDIYHLKRN